uniref:Uncharacterized protein LOC102805739 n=1 Tax=Saccoglossus kowalevskii TaxID=10224 RepID=A0ABM0MPI3_SACKO|nr:PREDICTED: uncharacterized protein LOC102805739 [Saccoglossus kowalevskii]
MKFKPVTSTVSCYTGRFFTYLIIFVASTDAGKLTQTSPNVETDTYTVSYPPVNGFGAIDSNVIELESRGSTQCSPFDSCGGRCGFRPKPLSIWNHTEHTVINDAHLNCFCDTVCLVYGDCCYDYELMCNDEREELTTDDYIGGQLAGTTPTGITETEFPNNNDVINGFQCVVIREYSINPLWVYTRCAPNWQDSYIEQLCLTVQTTDSLSILPVQGSDGNTYRNVFCAQCNYINKVTFWVAMSTCSSPAPTSIATDPIVLSLYIRYRCTTFLLGPSDSVPRICIRAIGHCDLKYSNTDISSKCSSKYNSIVIVAKETVLAVYKNQYCALCNGVLPSNIVCPVWKERDTPIGPLGTIEADDGVVMLGENEYDHAKLPGSGTKTQAVSYAVLITLNFDGQESIRYDSETGSLVPVYSTCNPGKVYDPIMGQCREVYCANGYQLVGSECVLVGTIPSVVIHTHPYNASMGFDSVSFTLTLECSLNFNVSCVTDVNQLRQEFHQFILNIFNITIGELVNVEVGEVEGHVEDIDTSNVNKTYKENGMLDECIISDLVFGGNVVFTVTITFYDVYWNLSDATFLQIFQKMSLVLMNEVSFEFQYLGNTVEVTIVNIDQNSTYQDPLLTMSYFSPGCTNGNFTTYSYPDATFVRWNGTVALYVNTTESVYEWDEFLITSYTSSSETGHGDVEYTVMVCEKWPYIKDRDCPRVRLNSSQYEIFPNRSIKYNDQIYDTDEYSIVNWEKGIIEICTPGYYDISPSFYDYPQFYTFLTVFLTLISLACLIGTFVTYAKFEELRTVPGLCIMSLTVSLFLAQLLFLIGADKTEIYALCAIIAITLHYLNLSNFSWMNVLAYDAFKTFSVKSSKFKSYRSSKSQIVYYSIYGWGSPLLIVIPCVILNFCGCVDFLFGYGYVVCWIINPYSLLFAFIIPIALILIVNTCFYISAIYHIRQTKQAVRRNSHRKRSDSDTAIYVKMSTVMGFAWIFGLIASFTDSGVFWVIFIIMISLQGVFIFVAFVCNKRVRALYRKRHPRCCRCFTHRICCLRAERERKRRSTASDLPLAVIASPDADRGYQSNNDNFNGIVVDVDDDVFV